MLLRGPREPACDELLAQTATASFSAEDVPALFRCLLVNAPTASQTMPVDEVPSYDLSHRIKERNLRLINPSDVRDLPIHNVQISASLSKMSYLSRKDLETSSLYQVRDVMEDQVKGFPIEVQGGPKFSTNAYIWLSKSSRTAYISFPGTRSLGDIRHDLDMRSVPVDSGQPVDILVHAGFRNKYFSVHDALVDILETHATMFDTVVTTGHSLGGALATIAAPVLSESFLTKKIECVTFGSPRVGNLAFVSWFKSRVPIHLRLVNTEDPVPWIPLSNRFHHVSDAVSMTASRDLMNVPDAPIGKRYWWALEDLDWSQVLKNHNLDMYINRVKYHFNN
jgi:predicted lipase